MAGAGHSRVRPRGEGAQSGKCGRARADQFYFGSHGSSVRPRHRGAAALRFAVTADGAGENGGRASQIHFDDSRIDCGTDDTWSGTASVGIAWAASGYLRGGLLSGAAEAGTATKRERLGCGASVRRAAGNGSTPYLQISELTRAL